MNAFVCIDCAQTPNLKIYGNLEDLETHIASDHLELFIYECEKCVYARFPTEKSVQLHMETNHKMTLFDVKYRFNPEIFAKRRLLDQKLKQCVKLAARQVNPISASPAPKEHEAASTTLIATLTLNTVTPAATTNTVQPDLDEESSRLISELLGIEQEKKLPQTPSYEQNITSGDKLRYTNDIVLWRTFNTNMLILSDEEFMQDRVIPSRTEWNASAIGATHMEGSQSEVCMPFSSLTQ